MADKQIIDPSHSVRLKAIISHVGAKSANEFAKGIDGLQSEISRILSGQRELSAALAYKIVKSHSDFRIEWIIDGEGEMLKLRNVDTFSPNENEPLEASATKFSSNLRALMSYHGVDAQGLSPLIELSPEVITQLLEQQCGPSLAILLRLRQHWDISIDALLFQDLSDPENMQNDLKEIVTVEQLRDFMKTLEDLKMKVGKLEKENEERRREEEEVKKRVEGAEPEDK